MPDVSKRFELVLPWNQTSHKRVSFHNSYHQRQSFRPKCEKSEKLIIKDEQVTLEPGETGYISLKFPAQSQPCSDQIYVFIMNQRELVEECFCINVEFQ